MAAYLEEGPKEVRECANCGSTEGLLRCSRCRSALFCSIKCQKAYWPFHKQECKKNEFADAMEEQDPKFAAWMRKHGKQAVLKDDEIDRLERAGKASSGPSREDVMDSMYGRALPKPKEASYTAGEKKAMALKHDEELRQERMQSEDDRAWEAIKIDSQLGLDCGSYKWHQNQSHIEIFCRLPTNASSQQVEVKLTPLEISVVVNMRPIIQGELFAKIKRDESVWYIEQRILYVTLLKVNRRGNYQNGSNNAVTFWRSILRKEPAEESLQVQYPPNCYYASDFDAEEQTRLASPAAPARPTA